jgi:alpha-mannosidase
MDAAKAWAYQLERFVVFLRDVIEPAVYSDAAALNAEAWQTAEPVSFEEARRAKFAPVKIGWQWGPRWTTAWFRVRGDVPRGFAGRRVVFRFSTDTEAQLWLASGDVRVGAAKSGGVPYHGLDVNRDAVTLFESGSKSLPECRGGETVELFVEAACNHMFGDRGLQWDPPEIHRRWNSETPGLFERCELAVLNEEVRRLKLLYGFAIDLAKQMPPESARGAQLFGALRRATNALPDDRVREEARAAVAELERVLTGEAGRAGGSATLCHAVGHAHIDTAWLWPLRETKRKCLRTFSSVLRNMERYPEFRFLCSQAQQYEYVEEKSPELFEQIKKRVAEGRWEPGGAMWIEPDCTCPSGESLVRQIIFADKYWREKFGGERGRQRFLYLPDTFGFPAQLPQIMKLAGLDTFVTNKLHWNSHNEFPHTTFVWRGLDGSEVLAHQTPGMDYNATMTPRELVRGEKTHKNKDVERRGEASTGARWLQPFGFGDGGGGPTDWSIEYGRLSANCEGLPRVKFSSVGEFLDRLHEDVDEARSADPSSVPVHEGELYLELHRGTYTTHARIKQQNAECERLLREAEILSFAGPTRLPRDEERRIKAELDKAWKLVLLNQFHDILPGSSIGWVYEDAERDYAEVRWIVQPIIDIGMRRWSEHVKAVDEKVPVCLFNLGNGNAGAYCEVDGELIAASTPHPNGVKVVDRASLKSSWAGIPIEGDMLISRSGLRLSHRLGEVEFDEQGRIIEMIRRDHEGTEHARVRGAEFPLNQLAVYEDRPRLWDGWDIDAEYVQKGEMLDSKCECTFVHDTPQRVSIRFARTFGRGSRIAQTYSVFAGDSHVSVDTEVDWREEHRILRALFPLRTSARQVRFGTQFGCRDMPSSSAAFEFPFQRFIADYASGVTLIFRDKYGCSLRDGVIGVSLLRSSRYPDAKADAGLHRFRYGVSGHAIDWSWGGAAESFLCPPRLGPAPTGRGDGKMRAWTPFECGMMVSAMKLSENTDRLIVRLSDEISRTGSNVVAWGFPVAGVEPVDLLERPIKLDGFRHDRDRNMTYFEHGPFEIVTLAVTRAD